MIVLKNKMWLFIAICVLCFGISTDAIKILVKDLTNNAKNISCPQDKEINITALEEDTLTFSDGIINNHDFLGTIKIIYRTNRATGTINVGYGKKDTACIKIDDQKLRLMSNVSLNINKDTGGRWRCTAWPDEKCFMNLHVKLKSSPLKVLQHNMVISTDLADMDEKYDHFGRAFYTDGDDINITCIVEDNTPATRNITLEYICSGQENEVVEGQPILGNATKDCYIVCTYKNTNDFTKTKVIFVPIPHNKEGYMKVNGHIARQNSKGPNGFGYKEYKSSNIFSNEDSVYLSCHTEIEGLVAKSNPENPIQNSNTYGLEILKFPNTFECYICNKTNNKIVINFIVDIKKLQPGALDSLNTTTNQPESSININAIIGSVIAVLALALLVIISKLIFKKWIQKKSTARNVNEEIPQTDQETYSKPYDHIRNCNPRFISGSQTIPTKATTHTNSQNTNERMPRTLDHRNSTYIDQPNQEVCYAEATPKHLRPWNTDTTNTITAFEAPQYSNENDLDAGLNNDLYVNEKEVVMGENLYDNISREPVYGNNESSS